MDSGGVGRAVVTEGFKISYSWGFSKITFSSFSGFGFSGVVSRGDCSTGTTIGSIICLVYNFGM